MTREWRMSRKDLHEEVRKRAENALKLMESRQYVSAAKLVDEMSTFLYAAGYWDPTPEA